MKIIKENNFVNGKIFNKYLIPIVLASGITINFSGCVLKKEKDISDAVPSKDPIETVVPLPTPFVTPTPKTSNTSSPPTQGVTPTPASTPSVNNVSSKKMDELIIYDVNIIDFINELDYLALNEDKKITNECPNLLDNMKYWDEENGGSIKDRYLLVAKQLNLLENKDKNVPLEIYIYELLTLYEESKSPKGMSQERWQEEFSHLLPYVENDSLYDTFIDSAEALTEFVAFGKIKSKVL